MLASEYASRIATESDKETMRTIDVRLVDVSPMATGNAAVKVNQENQVMTETELSAIEQRAAAATPGKWDVRADGTET
jgi:hypothetical protein